MQPAPALAQVLGHFIHGVDRSHYCSAYTTTLTGSGFDSSRRTSTALSSVMKASGSALHEPAAMRGPAQDWKSCEAIEPFGEHTDVIGEPGDFIRVHLVADSRWG